jgi:hypothetical protein
MIANLLGFAMEGKGLMLTPFDFCPGTKDEDWQHEVAGQWGLDPNGGDRTGLFLPEEKSPLKTELCDKLSAYPVLANRSTSEVRF